MDQLTPVWQEIEKLLDFGISIIPVRDRDEPPYIKKQPYQKWKQFQHRIIERNELFAAMEQHNTTAVAMICGRISGGLEVIDLDVKWLPGIDARLFNDLNTLYQDLFNRLRIHKSPSGGYHLIYRIKNFTVPGNQKLASRPATEKELQDAPAKIKCFLETRGEGGFVLAPPSLNYTVHQDVEIPIISAEERESLINLCRCYNQIIKTEEVKPPVKEDNYYDVNPFEHFNNSPEGQNVLTDYGWKFLNKSGDYLHFNRPGSPTNAIHASFITSKKLFHIFTTNTEFEPDRSYKPATALAILKFGGDKKAAYSFLVQRGYGKIKPEVELQLARRKSSRGEALPPNASEQAQKLHAELKNKLDELHPYGVFWKISDEAIKIDREAVYRVAGELGFRSWKQQIVQIVGYFINKVTERFFFDTLKIYIKEEDVNLYNDICNTYEAFLQRSGGFTTERIPLLDESIIIKDTRQTCYKFFQNGYVFITAEKYTFHEYKNLAGLIWADQVQQRQFEISKPGGLYTDFINLACGYTDQVKTIIGYLTHNYKDETTAYIIVQTEQCEDPKQGGGTGKNVFSSLLAYTTTIKTVPGTQVRYDEKFMQAWNGERIFAISDVPKKFDFEFLKELSSGTGLVKKLWQDEETFSVAEMPKFIVGTQFSYEVSDGGLRRRIIPLEFTDFFTRAGGVDVHFGCHFPQGWTAQDWVGYDNAIANAVRCWLATGLKLSNGELSASGQLKQFEQTYGALTRQFIEENWSGWVASEFVSNIDFNAQYNSFLLENNAPKQYSLSSIKMNRALEDWAHKLEALFNKDVCRRINSIMTKGREFYEKPPF